MSFKCPHFELYYDKWCKSFNKSADAIVLFYHYCLIQNGFECINNQKETAFLPDDWNSALKESYQIFYIKRSIKFRLEVFLVGEMLHIEIKRFTDLTDVSQLVKISDFLNLEIDYKEKPYKELYRNLNRLKIRIDWAIENIKPAKLISNGAKTSKTDTQTVVKPKETLDLINQIKQNRYELSKTSERRDSSNSIASICSVSSSSNSNNVTTSKNNKRMKKSTTRRTEKKSTDSMEIETSSTTSSITIVSTKSKGFIIENDIAIDPIASIDTNSTASSNVSSVASLPLPPPPIKSSTQLARANLFDYNPITNFIGYNKNVDKIKTIDEKIFTENDLIKNLFEKNNCKTFSIKMIDCFKIGTLKNHSAPIILTDKIKNSLNISSNETVLLKNKKAKLETKPMKRNSRFSKKLMSNTESENVKSINESDNESLLSNDTATTSRNKRKRSSFRSESSNSVETISSTQSTDQTATTKNVESKSKEINNEDQITTSKTSTNLNETNKSESSTLNMPSSFISDCTIRRNHSKKIKDYFHSSSIEKSSSDLPDNSKGTQMDLEASTSIDVSTNLNNSREQSFTSVNSVGKENAMVKLNTSDTVNHPAKKFKSGTDVLSTTVNAINEKLSNTVTSNIGTVKQILKVNNTDLLNLPINCIINNNEKTTPNKIVSANESKMNASFSLDTTATSPKKPGFITNFLKRFPVKISESTIAKQFEEAASGIRPLSFSFNSLSGASSTQQTSEITEKSIDNIPPTSFTILNNSTSEDSDCTIIDEKPGDNLSSSTSADNTSNQNDDLVEKNNSTLSKKTIQLTNVKLEKH